MDDELAAPLARLLLVLRFTPRRPAALYKVMWPDAPTTTAVEATRLAEPVLRLFTRAGFVRYVHPRDEGRGYVLADPSLALPKCHRVR